jgi:D-beta-D-heptose 7-phosphate kinase/D-beta-D-heptose 1-phosphate adenosyltransferase
MAIKDKILGLPALLKKLSVLRRQGKTIAFTNGCFDLMHIGHVKYLEDAGRGDRILIVGLNSDRSISPSYCGAKIPCGCLGCVREYRFCRYF